MLKNQRSNHSHHPFTAFQFWQRQGTIFSIPGLALFLLNIWIYIKSFELRILIAENEDIRVTNDSCTTQNFSSFLDNNSFELIKSHTLLTFLCGSWVLLILAVAIVLKLFGILSFVLCPRQILALKKRMHGVHTPSVYSSHHQIDQRLSSAQSSSNGGGSSSRAHHHDYAERHHQHSS